VQISYRMDLFYLLQITSASFQIQKCNYATKPICDDDNDNNTPNDVDNQS